MNVIVFSGLWNLKPTAVLKMRFFLSLQDKIFQEMFS